MKKNTTTQNYACPMHPEVTSDQPGMCPKCHMAFEKIKKNQLSPDGHDCSNSQKQSAQHNPNQFRQKFWLSLLLMVPTMLFSPSIQSWFGFDLSFTGSQFIPAIFGAIIFFYGGLVFLRSARGELAARKPGMMTLISMAIVVAFGYSLAVRLNSLVVWISGGNWHRSLQLCYLVIGLRWHR